MFVDKREQDRPTVRGTLVSGAHEFSVEASYASRYSVWVTGAEEVATDGTRLILRIDKQDVEMGPCRVIELERNGTTRARLVPYGNIHDFEKLFFRSKTHMLDSGVMNLPLVLSYKERIDPAFKEYVSDLTYDLNAYKNALDKIDEEFAEEPEAVHAVVQQGILSTFGPDMLRYLDSALSDLMRIAANFTENENEHHGFYFRKQLWNIILCCPIMARTNLKPRGYSGDSEMMRMIYVGGYRGESSFGKILHKHAMCQPAAEAVRNRRRDIASILREYIAERCSPRAPEAIGSRVADVSARVHATVSGDIQGTGASPGIATTLDVVASPGIGAGSDIAPPDRLKVLSVACGPVYELQDIVTGPEDARRLHFSLLDQDEQALLEASQVVRDIGAKTGVELSVDLIRESVRTMLVTRELRERWGTFDFIYSMGLFDYLTAPVATAVLRRLYGLLMPGGEMVIGNFHSENPTRYYMAYWLDWSIIYRNEQELLALASRLPGADLSIRFDETCIQMLLCIRRRLDAEFT